MTARTSQRAIHGVSTYTLNRDDPGSIPVAERDAMRQFMALLPDPADFATALPSAIVEMLETGVTSGSPPRAIDARTAEALRPYGLCEVRGHMLTNFGAAVRRAALGAQE